MITLDDTLLPYQRAFKADKSRFKYGLWSRQAGKDYTVTNEAVSDCKARDIEGGAVDWLIGAPGERQALETLEKAKRWAEVADLAIADYVEDRESSDAVMSSARIEYPNGSRIIAVPGNPKTARGYSANTILTEFAFFEDPDAFWRAFYPSITNPLRGGEKRLIVITSAGNRGTKAHDLWAKDNDWAKHKVSIYDAQKAGLPVNVEELRAAMDDPDGFAQEFECEWLDDAAILLPYELIAMIEAGQATTAVDYEYWQTASQWPVDLGIDFGRKKNLTVCWATEAVGDNYQLTREVLTLQKMSSPDQLKHLRPRIKKARRVCFDYTGPGIGLGDLLVEEFGEWNPAKDQYGKVELVTFTNQVKCEIFPRLKLAAEKREIGIPADRTIREDLHSVYRIVTQKGNVSYAAPHNKDGHADRCAALALCVRAHGYGAWNVTPPRPITTSKRARVIAARGNREVLG